MYHTKRAEESVTSARDQVTGTKQLFTGLVLSVALIILGAGCGGTSIRHKIEAQIAKSLQGRLGPAKSYSVSLRGSTLSIVRGNIKEIRVAAEEVSLPEGITLDKLDVVLENVRVDLASRTIKRCAQAQYTARISEDELEAYFRKRYPDIPELRMHLANHELRIETSPRPAGIRIPIIAYASLKTKNGTQVVLDLKRIDVGPIPTPGFAREFLETRFNPVFEASDIGFDAQISEVRTENNFLVLTGTFDPTTVLNDWN